MKVTHLRWLVPVLIVAAACGAYRLLAGHPPAGIALVRSEPWVIAPHFNLPQVATDEQLWAVLERMKPPSGKPNTNLLVHALRLWGPHADFGDPAIPSGAVMRDYFLRDSEFRRLAGNDTPALFILDQDGVRARPSLLKDVYETTGAVHTDDLLATLAEIGTPLSQPLETRQGTTTVGELLYGALNRFHLEQQEFEWSAISYARYEFPVTSWTNQHGQRITVDEVVEDLINHPIEEGVCGGTHRLEALVVLLRADEQAHALSPKTKRRIIAHLTSVAQLLVKSQHSAGHWTRSWVRGVPPGVKDKSELVDEILLTGHHLEWLALAPAEVQPPRETIVRAGQWLVRSMLEVEQKSLEKWYGPFTHAARALCLWRSVDPAAVWQAGKPVLTNLKTEI